MNVVVLVPVLNRPHRAKPLVESLRATTDARLVFLVQKSDRQERWACERAAAQTRDVDVVAVPFKALAGDYARKINHGVSITSEEWILQGADDLRFHPLWVDAAMEIAERTGARVIGTNDLCNPRVKNGQHSTHSLVHRTYVEEIGTVDAPGLMLHEGYFHNFCDDELVSTARLRGEFAHARGSHVEHLHPNCGSAEMDATYERGLDGARFILDRRLFNERRARVFGKRPAAGRRA